MKKRRFRSRIRAFTLLELLIAIGIISVLIGIVLPAMSSARQSGTQTVCLAHLHSIGQAEVGYLQANDFPAYFHDAITLEEKEYSYSWSDFLVKGRYLGTAANLDAIPDAGGRGGIAGIYLAGMVSQRDPVFQCPEQKRHAWGTVDGVPVSYRADYVITGHEKSRPVKGIYTSRQNHGDARLIWMGEAFTTLGGISSKEYVRETQLHLDRNEGNPLRHEGGSTYLFGDGHATVDKVAHLSNWQQLGLPWEPSR